MPHAALPQGHRSSGLERGSMLEIFALISNGTASIAHSVDTSGKFRCCVSYLSTGQKMMMNCGHS
jgi:hypothetical protein